MSIKQVIFLVSAILVSVLGYPRSHNGNLKIVGGKQAEINETPYMVAILRGGQLTCGGTLIAKDIVLTCAHCLTSAIEEFTVRVGSSTYSEGGEEIGVSNMKYHEKWNPFLNDFDLALVWLKTIVTIVNTASISIVPENTTISEGDLVNITGWGSETEFASSSSTLKSTEVSIIPSSFCNNAYNVRYSEFHMFCAGEENNGPCETDAGGPVVKNGDLVGVVSFNLGCGRAGFPGAYLSMPAFREWIRNNTNI